MDLYNENQLFKEYVDKYCTQNNITLEVAFTHALIKEMAIFYKGGVSYGSEPDKRDS